MSNDNDVEFPQGLYFKEAHPNSPDFVKGRVNIKVDEFIDYLEGQEGKWLNLDLKISKKGKAYAQVSNFEPKKQDESNDRSQGSNDSLDSDVDLSEGLDDVEDDLPF